MKTFATSREHTTLQVDDSAVKVMWKEFPVWEAKAQYIKSIRFNGSDCTMEVVVNSNGDEEAHPIELSQQDYEDVKSLFTEDLDGVQVSSLSRKKQIALPLTGLIFIFIITAVMAFFTRESILAEAKGNSGWFMNCCYYLGEKIGFTGVLIMGGVMIGLLGLVIFKRYFFPKQASTVKFHYGDRMMIFRTEDDEEN